MIEVLERPRKVLERQPEANHNDTLERDRMAAEQSTHTTPERWLPVPGYEGYYEVSDQGKVRSVDRVITRINGTTQKVRSRQLRQYTDKLGYKSVCLYRECKGQTRKVHFLVMAAFVGPRPSGMEVRHLDGNPAGNSLSNLKYGTSSENTSDTIAHGNHPELSKTHCKRGHVLSDFNLVPSTKSKGKRNCLACQRAGSWLYRRPEMKDKMQEISDAYFIAIAEESKNE